jgi:lytic murein transglycosylase
MKSSAEEDSTCDQASFAQVKLLSLLMAQTEETMIASTPVWRGLVSFAALALLCLPSAVSGADFASCLAGLRGPAHAGGVSDETFDAATRNLRPDPDILGFLDAQPEFKTPIWDYLAGLVDDERVADGRANMSKWHQAFETASSRYGVDAAVVAAVWGVESNFGGSTGTRPVVQSLATLSCEGRRQAYFRTEFVSALKILEAGDVDPARFTGSWAGAFGHTQFMPSTFLRTAVDLDGDGRRDVVGSVPDAIGSTANYLRKGGWVSGQPWGFEVRLPGGYNGPSGRTRKQPMSSWAARGITHIDGRPLGAGESAGLMLPAGPNGPAFLVTRNFEAIYSYNAAESYALAIALLSDRLRGRPGLVTPWPTDDPGLSRAARRDVQAMLMKRGYDLDGKADGVIGTKTRQAILDYQTRAGLKPDGRASASVLAALKR